MIHMTSSTGAHMRRENRGGERLARGAHRWSVVAWVGLLTIVLSFSVGCRRDQTQGAGASSEVLTVYCGRNETMIAPVIARFTEETGIEVRVNYAGSSELAATLLEEGRRTPADVFFAQDASTLGFLAAEGMLRPLPASITEGVDARFRAVDGTWVGTSGRARVLSYNTTRVRLEELPARIEDLVDPRWANRLGWTPENTSFQSFVAAMVAVRGEDATRAWVRGIQDQGARAYPSNTPLVVAVGAGEIDAGLTNHYYLHRLINERGPTFPVRNHYFRNGGPESLVNIAGVGILATSPRTEAAERFVAFLLSEPTQTYFATETYEIPINPAVETVDGVPRIGELHVPEVDLADLQNLERTVQLLRDAGTLP